MKVKIDATILRKAVENVIRVIPNVSVLPIMECALLRVENDCITLIGGTLERRMEITLTDGFQVLESGVVAVSAKTLLDILKKVNRGDTVTLREKDGKMLIEKKGMRCSLSIASTDESDYPLPADMRNAESVTIPFKELKTTIKKTIFAAGSGDSEDRSRGCGFTLSAKDGKMRGHSIDGFRIAVRNTEIADTTANFEIRLSKPTLVEILKMTDKENEEKDITIAFTSKFALFTLGNTKLSVLRLVEKGIDIDKIVVEPENAFEANTAEFYGAIDCLKPFVQNYNCPVRMQLENDKITFSISTPVGEGKTEVAIKNLNANVPLKEMEVGFNILYLLDAVAAIDGETFKAIINTPITPAKFIDIDSNYVVLPVRLKAE